ncbi:hypothetical protein M8J77_003503 [Diaphorina citri]|nr:hypothetical protein M8J77_003503 [Diaphorina citri]
MKRKLVLRKEYRKCIEQAKRRSNDELIKNSKNPSRTMWNIINSNKQNRNAAKTTTLTPNEFNNNFCDAPLSIVNSIPPAPSNPHTLVTRVDVSHVDEHFYFCQISESTLRNTICSLPRRKGKDLLGLNLDIILVVEDLIAPPLTKLINKCLATGIFPDSLKHGLIHPVYKNKGDVNDASMFRPITILPTLGKIFEKIITEQITSYLTYSNLFSPNQFGFRKSLCTTDAVNFFSKFISNSFNEKTYLYATMCDLSRAFECLSHDVFLAKLKHYKLDSTSIKLLSSYLEGRTHRVQLGEKTSDARSVTTGIPTGSIQGLNRCSLYT